jgi:butyrate kinase
MHNILAINPGSTSTKLAVFTNEDLVFEKTLRYSIEDIDQSEMTIEKDLLFRKKAILQALDEANYLLENFDAIVGRGGLLKPISGGVYTVNTAMIDDLKKDPTNYHASNLGALLSYDIASGLKIPAYIVDPVVVDEMDPVAKLSGHPDYERISIFHALNQKAVALRASKELGKTYNQSNFIVAHLGGGISVGAHKRGRVIDVNNALDGEGPYTPERSGTLPVGQLVSNAFSGKISLEEMKKCIRGKGGLVAYLNTNDAKQVSAMCDNDDKKALLIYEGMAYQVAKEIAANAAVLKGKVDAIIITGGIAYDHRFVTWIKERVEFIANVIVYPGEDELHALTQGALRVLRGEEKPKIYC